MRNNILLSYQLFKQGEQEKQFNFEWLLDSYQQEIDTQEKDLQYQIEELERNKKLIEEIRKEVKENGKYFI